MGIAEEIDAVLDEVIELRRDLHAHPEIAYQEERTASRVHECLENIPGIEIRSGLAKTGLVATLRGDFEGPAVALRADMDALPMEDACGKPWASKIPGMAHTCGHDGHTAALVGAARVLGARQDKLSQPVKFVFQPAEEGGAGADKMIQDGVLEAPEVAAIFGLHGWPTLDRGQIGVCLGPMLASSTAIEIEVSGKGGHAAMPHLTHDPVVAAAQLITALQTLVSRTLNPLQSGVVSICKLDGGTAFNVIPDRVKLLGTVRALSQETRDLLFHKIRQVSEQISGAFDCTATLTIHEGYPVTVNAESAFNVFEKSAREVVKEGESIVRVKPSMGGEDFSFYAQKIPSNFWFLGVRPVGAQNQAQLHQPKYEFPDDMLEPAIRLHCATAFGFAKYQNPESAPNH
ncbi:MAG: M20 family metallopeptidase [Verrucomicrobiota bacterium]